MIAIDSPFYLNVVGYKETLNNEDGSERNAFYLNVVGYKEWKLTVQKNDLLVLSERSGI